MFLALFSLTPSRFAAPLSLQFAASYIMSTPASKTELRADAQEFIPSFLKKSTTPSSTSSSEKTTPASTVTQEEKPKKSVFSSSASEFTSRSFTQPTVNPTMGSYGYSPYYSVPYTGHNVPYDTQNYPYYGYHYPAYGPSYALPSPSMMHGGYSKGFKVWIRDLQSLP